MAKLWALLLCALLALSATVVVAQDGESSSESSGEEEPAEVPFEVLLSDIFQFMEDCFVDDNTDYVSNTFCNGFKDSNETLIAAIDSHLDADPTSTEITPAADERAAEAEEAAYAASQVSFLAEQARQHKARESAMSMHPRHRTRHHKHHKSAAQRHYEESHEEEPRYEEGFIPYLHASLWPDATVYVTFSSKTQNVGRDVVKIDETSVALAAEAMLMWEAKTCIDFTKVAESDNSKGTVILSGRLSSQSANGCSSQGSPTMAFPGNGKFHAIWLSPKCVTGSIAHELAHAMGFSHTMQRTDRDQFVHTIETSPGWAEWGSQYTKRTGAEYKELPTAQIPGADKVAQAKNYYKSIMMYPADSEMEPVHDYWVVDKANPTEAEKQMLKDVADRTQFMGQRAVLSEMDWFVVNTAYDCYPLKLKNAYADVQAHTGQTTLQLLKKIQQQKKATVKPGAALLFKNDETVASNEVAYTEKFTDKNQEYIVKVLDKCITFEVERGFFAKLFTSAKKFELCVDLGWKLPRVTSNLKLFHNIDVATYKKDSTALSDNDKTLTELGLDNGQTVMITLA